MKNWVTKPIKDVVIDLHQGLNTAGYKIKFYDSGYPIIQTRNLENGVIDLDEKIKFMSKADWLIYKDKYKPNIGDVFLTNIGTIGKTAVVTEEQDYLIHWNIFIFKVDKKIIDPYYLKTFLDTPFCFDYYQSCQKGGTVNFITKKMIEVLEIPLPPLPEQQLIVAILDEAFASIAIAKANAEQNLKNAKQLFESYLQGVFENKGEGWEVNILKEVCELKSGTTISPSLERTEGDVLYTKVGDMNLPDNEVEINTSSRFVNSNEIKLNQIIPEGAIIFPKRGGAIATNKKRKIVKPTIVDLNTMAIIPSKKIDNDYFFHWFQLFDLNSISNGANIPQINNYSFDEVYIPYPKSIREQQSIVQKLDALSLETKKLEAIYNQKLNDLEELKKSVLQKAFSGEFKTEKVLV
jgi:type I restriction enzyme S subunit